MFYTKDGLTKEKLIELLQFSLSKECQFIIAVRQQPGTVDGIYSVQEGSIIRFLKMKEEEAYKEMQRNGTGVFSLRYSVKICVEDFFWEEVQGGDTEEGAYAQSGKTPIKIKNTVSKILNA